MKVKFLNHFKNFDTKKFTYVTTLSLLVLDLLTMVFLYQSFNIDQFHTNAPLGQIIMSKVNVSPAHYDKYFLHEMYTLFKNTLSLMLMLFLINNIFFYTFFTKGRSWAYKFVSGYCFFGALINLTMIFDPNDMGIIWTLINTLMIPAYLYFYFGVRTLKSSIILAPEKTAQ